MKTKNGQLKILNCIVIRNNELNDFDETISYQNTDFKFLVIKQVEKETLSFSFFQILESRQYFHRNYMFVN